ncbi:MAG: hypothetical protein ACM3SX_20810, partial [Deltaproteobacteria bacterium]
MATPAFGIDPSQARVAALHEITLELFAADDPSEIAGKLLSAAGRVVTVDGVSLWVPRGDTLECRGAIGENREQLTGVAVAASAAGEPLDSETGVAVFATGVAVNGRLTVVLRATRARAADEGFSDAEQDLLRQLA